ncbi:MAG: 2-amino-4-hydroxy-6-hydroxymethyldihydropteridine diphosphokinase [candidate division Zixibacteria bacterium]|nr:2-amino-4-hydroxy-6-hydroxymethyldihydropteridine diphosphokinase [candidate division Zixibacteria bacterium]
MTSTAYILLGSNLGDREKYINSAIAMIKEIPGLRLSGSSSVYSSPAQQMASGTPPFLNQAIKIDTQLTSFELLATLEKIEQALDRSDKGKYLSRTIDLDILLYDTEIVNSKRLTIPHPEFLNRAFALIPVIEIDPRLVHPLTGKRLKDYLNDEDFKLVRQKEENAPISC